MSENQGKKEKFPICLKSKSKNKERQNQLPVQLKNQEKKNWVYIFTSAFILLQEKKTQSECLTKTGAIKSNTIHIHTYNISSKSHIDNIIYNAQLHTSYIS